MSYEDTLKELDEQIEEAKKAESVEEAPEEVEEDEVIEPETEEKTDEEAEEALPAEEKVKEDKQDNANGARLRIEAAKANKRARELEEENRQLRESKAQPQERPQSEIPEYLQPLVQEHNKNKGWEVLTTLEGAVRSKHDDYDAVVGAYTAALAQGNRIRNPDLNPVQLVQMTKDEIFSIADNYAANGFDNPAEEMYLRAKEMGFKAPEAKEETKKSGPDMAKVASNRARNAGMAAATGGASEGGSITAAAYMNMTVAERMKIPKSERDRLTGSNG